MLNCVDYEVDAHDGFSGFYKSTIFYTEIHRKNDREIAMAWIGYRVYRDESEIKT